MLRRLVAQRAKTAREGMELIGQLVERFGYADSGRTYVVADPREAWLRAGPRAALRAHAPDDKVVILPNVYIIGEVDLDDTANFRLARSCQLRRARAGSEPERERFSFRKAYQTPERLAPGPAAVPRPGDGYRRHADLAAGRAAAVCRHCAQKLAVADVVAILAQPWKGSCPCFAA